ncbi:MAG TPA: hypothetical protein VMZ92_13190 [Planctomycetota bacterium]|nr:hypothetical protein [Planctomycetota bacterium]
MMRYAFVVLTVTLAGGLLVSGLGCSREKEDEGQPIADKEKGLLERAGAAADAAVQKTVDVTGTAVDKTKDAAGKAVDKTREVTGEGLKKAGELIKPDEKKEE